MIILVKLYESGSALNINAIKFDVEIKYKSVYEFILCIVSIVYKNDRWCTSIKRKRLVHAHLNCCLLLEIFFQYLVY